MKDILPQDTESRRRRRDRIYKPLAAIAGAGLLVSGYNLATTPREVDSRSVTVSSDAPSSEAVCSAVEDLGKANDIEVNKEACLEDVGRVKLSDGTVVNVTLSKIPVAGIGRGSIGFNVPIIETSIDKDIQQKRP